MSEPGFEGLKDLQDSKKSIAKDPKLSDEKISPLRGLFYSF